MARPEQLRDPHFQREAPISLQNGVVHALWDAIAYADQWAPLNQLIEDIRAMGRMMGNTIPEDPVHA